MPNIRDFMNGRNIVILHSEIRVVHRPAADVRYLSSARMLCTLHSKISEKVKVKGRKSLAFINYLLPKYDDDNDVRDCWNNSIQA